MFSRQSFLLLIAMGWLFSPPLLAQDSAREAFRLAEKKDWAGAQAYAGKSSGGVLEKLMTWQYLLDSDTQPDFHEIAAFIAANPHWPEQTRLRIRAEQALHNSAASNDDIIHWFADDAPITGAGKIALARALISRGGAPQDETDTLVREGWRDGDFDEAHETDILASFKSLLTEDDHIARADRLLWEEKTTAAKRMLPLLPKSHRYLAEARTALILDKKLASLTVSKVPDSLQDDPGLIYNRMQWRARRGDNEGVREMLLTAPDAVPYPEKWWRSREMQVRMAIDEGDYGMAAKLLERHGDLPGKELAEAAWLSGWLQLEFLKSPAAAYDIFARMYESVGYPVSLSRAAFWAGRAAKAKGDSGTADRWFETASRYPTTFYGQLAIFQRRGDTTLRLPSSPSISEAARTQFENDELVQALKLCLQSGARDMADKLAAFLIEKSGDEQQTALVAELAVEHGYPHLGVRSAKKALQKNIVLTESSYPRPDTPDDLAVERPLALAIARQESEFDPYAVSRAGAMGLAQLRPSTAKETARKSGIRYDKKRLFEADYNMLLGSHYLSRMIESYDGSYVLAIAAYNAGPGNVRKWIRQFGTPGNDVESAINWIEQIPFAETRNYVQRVMENLQVYRQLEAGTSSLMLAQDLAR